MSITAYCPQCRAQPGARCTSKKGKPTATHKGRIRAAYAKGTSYPSPAPTVTKNPARNRDEDREPFVIPSEIDVLCEDAQRVARNRTFGITDDTLDPVEICSELALRIDLVFEDVYSQEELDAELDKKTDEIRTLGNKLDDVANERDAALRKVIENECRIEDLEEELARVRASLATKEIAA